MANIYLGERDKNTRQKRYKVENWLKKNAKYIKLKSIERELNLPAGTIQRHVKNSRSISDKHIDGIYSLFEKIVKYPT